MPAKRIYYPQRVSEGKIGASVPATIEEDAMSGVAYQTNRRCFLKASAAISAVACGGYWLPPFAEASDANTENIIGPKPGYSPQVGTLVSMLTWMRSALIRPSGAPSPK